MIKEISPSIIFVKGAKCSAIYDFLTTKVYSLNDVGTNILIKSLYNDKKLDEEEMDYINEVKKALNIDLIQNKDYIPERKCENKLYHAWLELTQKCTSRCIHCYEGCSHDEVANPLSFNEWKDVIYELKENGCTSIQFIGGEPTLYKELPKLVEYAKSLNYKTISIFTNLFNMSDRLLNAITQNKIIVHFSIYGSNNIAHDSITNAKGSFDRLVRNIEKLQKSRVRMIAHVVIMRENEEERESIYSFLKKFSLEEIRYDEIRKVYGEFQTKHIPIKSHTDITIPNFRADCKYFENSISCNTCLCGKMVISTDGTVYPCEFDHNTKYGNIREEKISEILNKQILTDYWHLDFSQVESCMYCEYRFACKDCRPLAFAENGNLFEKNPRCKYNPYTGVWKND